MFYWVKMEKEFYYRYFCGKESIFKKVVKWFDEQTKKKHGKLWAKEYYKLGKQINKSISWLPEYPKGKNIRYYFTKKGAEKYEKTLLKVHKKILQKKIIKKEFEFLIKNIENKKIIFKKKKRIGELVCKDKYQIGIKE
jgi:hypothetical protein